MKNLKKLYSMTVCFVSAMVLLCCITAAILNIFDVTFPEHKYRSRFIKKFSSIDGFISSTYVEKAIRLEEELPKERIIAKMQRKRTSYIVKKAFHIQKIKDGAAKDLMDKISMIIVTMLMWIIHWKIYALRPQYFNRLLKLNIKL